jgi:cytoskeletal protein CcmA (bactofilin family)
LTCGGSVTVGENGSFNGDIEADDLILGGKIQGRVVVHKLIVLEATSEFEGELTCTTLHVNEGAQFNGTSSMGKQAVEQKLLASKSTDDASNPDQFEPMHVQDEEQKTDNAFSFNPSESESDSEIRDRLS